jgi:alkylation response protein AidB-like acyl-CoA dehydrogenase
MDVRLSPEQQTLRDSAARAVDQLGVHAVADLDDGERRAKLSAAIAGAGWRELRAATDEGGPWASAVEVAIVAEELGRGLADAAFVGPTLAAELRRLVGAPAAADLETVVLDDAFAVDTVDCSSALAVAADGNVNVVALGAAAGEVDLTRPARVPGVRGADLGRLTDEDHTRWTALGLALSCADLVGVMRGAVNLANAYAKDRRQYGVQIGSFQAVQHLLADALVATEGSRSVSLHAAWAVDALPPADAVAAGAVAKAYCARAARMVCESSIQVHGGIGNTWECLAHVYLRRALLSIDIFGGVGTNLERVLAHAGIEQ